MTRSVDLGKSPDVKAAESLETILIVGGDAECRAFVRNALSAEGYRVLEAVNQEHANAITAQFENRIELILGCFHTDQESSDIKMWHASNFALPLVLVSTAQPMNDLTAGEMTLRVRLALESARPSRSILVVDEDESERRWIAAILETAGYRVTQAENGKEAVALLANDPPDLLLTDIFMAEMDGLELIQDVRKHRLKTVIVAMSADGYLSIARLLGAKGTLKKPVPVDQLLRTLGEISAAEA